jgi:hypothetical protein
MRKLKIFEIEVHQIQEMPDFPEDVQKAAEGFEHSNAVI